MGAAVGYQSELGINIPDQVRFYYEQGNTRVLKIYSTSSPNNHLLELSYRQYTIHIEKYGGTNKPKYLKIYNFKTIGGDIAGLGVKEGEYIYIKNINTGKLANFGLSISSSLVHHVYIDSCTINSEYNFDYSQAGTNTGTTNRGPREGFYIRGADNIEFSNSTIHNFTHANINIGRNYNNDPSENCKIYNNKSTFNLAYGGRTVVEAGTHFLEYFNNVTDGAGVQSQFNGQNNHIHHNIFKNVRSTPLKHYHTGWGISLFPYSNIEDVTGNIIENNLVVNCESGGLLLKNNTISVVANNTIRNNMFIDNGKHISHFSLVQNQTSNINLAIRINDPI